MRIVALCLLIFGFYWNSLADIEAIETQAKYLSKNGKIAELKLGKNVVKLPVDRIQNYRQAKTGAIVTVKLYPYELGFSNRSPSSKVSKPKLKKAEKSK